MLPIYNKANSISSSSSSGSTTYLTRSQADSLYLNKQKDGTVSGSLSVLSALVTGDDITTASNLHVLGDATLGDSVSDKVSLVGATSFTQIPSLISSNTETYSSAKQLITKEYADSIPTTMRANTGTWSGTQTLRNPIIQDNSGNQAISFDSSNNILVSKRMVLASPGIESSGRLASWTSLETWTNSYGVTISPQNATDSGAPLIVQNDNVLRAKGGPLCLTLDSTRAAGLRVTNTSSVLHSGTVYAALDGSNQTMYFNSPNGTYASGQFGCSNLAVSKSVGLGVNPMLTAIDTQNNAQWNVLLNANSGSFQPGVVQGDTVMYSNKAINLAHWIPSNTTVASGLRIVNNVVTMRGGNATMQVDGSGNYVNISGDLISMSGNMSLSSAPILTSYTVPATNNTLTSKRYVDDAVAAGVGAIPSTPMTWTAQHNFTSVAPYCTIGPSLPGHLVNKAYADNLVQSNLSKFNSSLQAVVFTTNDPQMRYGLAAPNLSSSSINTITTYLNAPSFNQFPVQAVFLDFVFQYQNANIAATSSQIIGASVSAYDSSNPTSFIDPTTSSIVKKRLLTQAMK